MSLLFGGKRLVVLVLFFRPPSLPQQEKKLVLNDLEAKLLPFKPLFCISMDAIWPAGCSGTEYQFRFS